MPRRTVTKASIRSGDYYRCKTPCKHHKVGEIVCVTNVTHAEIKYCHGEDHYFNDLNGFLEQFEHAPDGADERAREITALLSEIRDSAPEMPKLLAETAEDGMSVKPGSLRLMNGRTPEKARRAIAAARNSALKFRKSILDKKKRIEALMAEQSHALEGRMHQLEDMVDKAQEAIWTISLYLGKNETIAQLKKGKTAPKDTPITIRQLRLNMDEECAIASDKGGIDYKSIEQFDAWVKNPQHLQQVLPETKGVVAFHVRGKPRSHDEMDPWLKAMEDAENMRTYFLIRNGECLYRICTELDVGWVLFPTERHFEKYFFRDEYDWESRKSKRVSIKPGSRDYMKAMQRADKEQRNFMRCLLFLQGLIDRTKVFRPMPSPDINLMNPSHHDSFLNLIRDAEMVLSDGRPRFSDWLRMVNSKLEVGHRIVGDWDSYDLKPRNDEYRSYPKWERPSSFDIHTIEAATDSGGFLIRFPRKRYGGGYYERRASYTIYTRDKNFIDIDAFDEESARYYLGCRLDRGHYTRMFPLLKAAIRAHAEEARAEQPFSKMLMGSIQKKYDDTGDMSSLEKEVYQLMRWWKYKNKVFRALSADDAKALRMIVREYGLRRERAEDLANQAPELKHIILELKKLCPDAIAILHMRVSDYMVISPMNDQNMFVRVQVFRHSKREDTFKSMRNREWQLLGKTIERYHVVWRTDRWSHFPRDVRREHVLTDNEVQEIIRRGWDMFREDRKWVDSFDHESHDKWDEKKQRWIPNRAKNFRWKPLAAQYDPEKREFLFYANARAPHIPKTKCSGRIIEPPIDRAEVAWKRKKNELTLKITISRLSATISNPPWDSEEVTIEHTKTLYSVVPVSKSIVTIEMYQDNMKTLAEESKLCETVKEQHKTLELIADRARSALRKAVAESMLREERRQFDEDLGDPELWEDHISDSTVKRRLEAPWFGDFWNVMIQLLDRDIMPGGQSVGRLLKIARKFKIKYDTEAGLPRDFVFPESVNLESDDEDEEEGGDEDEDEEEAEEDYEEG